MTNEEKARDLAPYRHCSNIQKKSKKNAWNNEKLINFASVLVTDKTDNIDEKYVL